MYTIILAAVDGSPRAQGVVDAALAVAERFGGRVHLFPCGGGAPRVSTSRRMRRLTTWRRSSRQTRGALSKHWSQETRTS